MFREESFMEKEGKCTIIMNPTAGHERAPKYLPLLQEVLKKRFNEVDVKVTGKPGDATTFAMEAAKAGRDVICMGGDGTINETINGMVPVDSPSTFGFIPFGTVNDLARALHIPRSPKGAIRMLETAVRSKVDVGRVNNRYFINVVAAGSISEAVGKVTIKEKTLFGSLAYFIKGATVLNKQKSYHFKVETDTGRTVEATSTLIAAMLTDSAGSFHNLLPPEERNKGLIKLCLMHDFEWTWALKSAPKLFSGMQMGPDFLTVVSFKKARISIEEDEPLVTNVDGDPGPTFPLDMEIFPDRLPVFTPKDPVIDRGILPKFSNLHFHLPWSEEG